MLMLKLQLVGSACCVLNSCYYKNCGVLFIYTHSGKKVYTRVTKTLYTSLVYMDVETGGLPEENHI